MNKFVKIALIVGAIAFVSYKFGWLTKAKSYFTGLMAKIKK